MEQKAAFADHAQQRPERQKARDIGFGEHINNVSRHRDTLGLKDGACFGLPRFLLKPFKRLSILLFFTR